MFATDSDFKFFADLATFCDRDAHQRANSISINANEGVFRKDALQNVAGQKFSRIIPGEAKTRLCEIIGPKRKKLGFFSNLIRHHTRPRQFNHCADQVTHFDSIGLLGLACDTLHYGLLFV